jgi:HTH-type transcriptional regulator, glycine betaine synthesis regulator
MNLPQKESEVANGLNPVEAGFISFFVHLATTMNLPRSVGEIFGYLFSSESPRAFDEIVARLGISKGSASQGLKWLTSIGAISQIYVPRDRRTFYVAETRMRKLFSKALQESLRPSFEANSRLVAELDATITAESEPEDSEHYRGRLASLRAWNEKALFLLPLLDKLFSLPAPLFPFNLFGGGPPADSDSHS